MEIPIQLDHLLGARDRAAANDTFIAMKPLLSAIIAVAISCTSIRAENPVKDAVDTATNVGHAAVRHTTEAAETVADALTPEPDARRADVTMTDYKFDMPTELKPGKTAFVVKNAGKRKHNFEIKGAGIDRKFQNNVAPGETRVLHVVLERGTYDVTCPVDFHTQKGMKATVTVK
jgi:uncharacterized cupredoxin-like copper-binding protein